MTDLPDDAAAVLDFWREAGPKRWFARDAQFDARFHDRFRDLHFAAARRELDAWIDHPQAALALLLLLDQFPRNCFRGTAHMFATDPLARTLARRALQSGHDQATDAALRVFFYLPFEHSEDIADQDLAIQLLQPLGDELARYAVVHQDVIRRFGRFPHRNPALGRATTAEEQAFLDGGGFSG